MTQELKPIYVCSECYFYSSINPVEHTRPCSQQEWEDDNGGPCGHGGHTPSTEYVIGCSGTLIPHYSLPDLEAYLKTQYTHCYNYIKSVEQDEHGVSRPSYADNVGQVIATAEFIQNILNDLKGKK